jgi:lysozyme
MEGLFYFYRMAKRKRKQKTKRYITIFLVACLLTIAYMVLHLYKKDLNAQKRHMLLTEMPAGFSSFGIDVSHHQGKIDWDALLHTHDLDSVIHFVYCKATEGADHVDKQWENNRKSLSNLGVLHGAYHFFSNTSDPIHQADHFLSNWKKTDDDLPPVLDVETDGLPDKDLIGRMQQWLDHVEVKSGMRPVIYTSLHFYETKFKGYFRDYKFWIAAYSRQPDMEDPRVIHWQYSESGSIPGIRKKVDLNVSKIAFL